MLDDFKRALARVQSDFGFYIDCQTNPAVALAGYDLTPDERSALIDPGEARRVLKRGVGVVNMRPGITIKICGTHDWVNAVTGGRGGERTTATAKVLASQAGEHRRGAHGGGRQVDGSDRLSEPEADVQTVWPFDIGIVGTGIVGTHQLTREAEEVIRRCKRTFVIDSGYGIPEYLETLCPEVTELGRSVRARRKPSSHVPQDGGRGRVGRGRRTRPCAWRPTAIRGSTAIRRR